MERRVALLINPVSGRGRGARAGRTALTRLRDAGLTVITIEERSAGDAALAAERAMADGVDALVVCGGDGTVQLGARILAGGPTPLGLVPAGTGNDTARYLGIPRDDPAAAADVVVAGRTRSIDLARVGDRCFVTVMAAGFDARVNERANRMTWPHGQMRYNLATIAELRTFRPTAYELALDDRIVRLEAMLVAVGNGPSYGGGLRITEGAALDDGLLDVVVIRPMSNLALLRTFPRLFDGTHVRHPAYERHRVRRASVRADGIVAYADGERLGALPLTVEVAPGSLRVLSPV